MAYSYSKAEDHIKTGKFNIKASPNSTLIDYGNHFSTRLGLGHARQLLIDITYELINRDRDRSSSRYNGTLSQYEKAAVNKYSKLVNIASPFAPSDPYLVKIIKAATLDSNNVTTILTELSDEYSKSGTDRAAALPVKEIQSFYKALSANALTQTQLDALSVAVVSCVLLLNAVCAKAGFSLHGSTEGFHNGDLSIKISGAVSTGIISVSTLLSALDQSSIKVVAENGPVGLTDMTFSAPSAMNVEGQAYSPKSFKDMYKILKSI